MSDLTNERKLIASGSSRQLFKYVNSKTSLKSPIPPLIDDDGATVGNDYEKAELFNDYFRSVFVNDNGTTPPLIISKVVDECLTLSDIYFSEFMVSDKIKKLKSNSSSGYDGLPPSVLKHLNNFLAGPLAYIFNLSLSTGELPADWKKSIVVPIFKKGSKNIIKNYRPVSITSVVCKLMERIIKDNIISYLYQHGLLSNNQYGFLPRKSTNLQLLEYFNKISTQTSHGCPVDSVYLDYSKAFDSIVHSKLIYKLAQCGISDNLLNWISLFIINRFQSIKVRSALSNWTIVLSGVPQGSVLGSLLFVIYINDLCQFSKNLDTLYLFADDAKCYAIIKSQSDCLAFQKALNDIVSWSDLWQLDLAADKCKIVSYVDHTDIITFDYSINSVPLVRVTEIIDLGIKFSNDLTFSSHIDDICCKARQRASIILNCFRSKDPATLLKAFITFVRPILEYCSNLWNPYKKSDIDKIESVQRRFTKRLNNMHDLQYTKRLELLGLDSLETRRLKADLYMYFKIIKNLTDIPLSDFFKIRTGSTRNNGLCLYKSRFNSNSERYFFRNRYVNAWNSLPGSAVHAESLSAFKLAVASHDLSLFVRV